MWEKIRSEKTRIIYTICFALLCLIDQRTKTTTGLDGWLESFRDLTGVVVALILLAHDWQNDSKKYKTPWLVWSLICVVGGVLFCLFGEKQVWFLNDRVVICLNVLLFGFVSIHLFYDRFVCRKHPKCDQKMLGLWGVMMVLMILSRSEYIWPLTYLIMFGAFYLTPFSEKERNDLFLGMLDGLVLAFLLMQGWCFVFRPYDEVRYAGAYGNCNQNALFYTEVLAAVFTRILYGATQGTKRWIQGIYWLGTGVLYSLIFMTIGRIAWATAMLLGILFLAAMRYVLQKKNFLKNAFLLILCFCLTFPLTFGAVRYLPPVFHHPVWFWGEWSEEKVHSWDAWDSEKYIDLDELLNAAVGRITDSVKSLTKGTALLVYAAENLPEIISEQQGELTEDPRYEAALWKDPSMAADSIAVRREVYAHYFRNLNLWGHPYSEQGFQLTPEYWIGHAHNIYLQYGTDFGMIVMVIYIILVLWTAHSMAKRFLRDKEIRVFGWLLLFLIPNVFGIFELSWGVGSLAVAMMFVAWREAICNED